MASAPDWKRNAADSDDALRIPEPAEQWETVKGSELKEGDRVLVRGAVWTVLGKEICHDVPSEQTRLSHHIEPKLTYRRLIRPTPLHLVVGHRYKRADGELADVLGWHPDGDHLYKVQQVGAAGPYYANAFGRTHTSGEYAGDLIEDLGPVTAERTRPKWWAPEAITVLRRVITGQGIPWKESVTWRPTYDELRRRVAGGDYTPEEHARDMLRELGEAP